MEQQECKYCMKKGKEIEIYFLDNTNNLRLSRYCPWCGRPYADTILTDWEPEIEEI